MKKLFFLILFFYSFPSWCIVSHSLQEHPKSGHKVLVTGDCHDSNFDKITSKQINDTQKIIENYNGPFSIICEGNNSSTEIQLIKEFNARKNFFSERKIPVKFVEDRPKKSDSLNIFFESLKIFYQSKKSEIPTRLEHFDIPTPFVFTFGDFKKYMAQSQAIMQKRITAESNNPHKLILQEILNEVSDTKKDILNEFSNVQDDEKFHKVILNRLNANPIENLWAGITKFRTLFLKDFDYKVADAGFLAEIFTLEQKKQNALLFVGMAHQQELIKRLERAEYKLIGKEEYCTQMGDASIYKFPDNYLAGYLHNLAYFLENNEETKNLLRIKMNEIIKKADQQRMISLCKVCAKSAEAKNLKQLSLCSKCKVTKYCSKDCQKKDWPYHSAHCLYLKKEKEQRLDEVKQS